jgi:hypothetical protein
VESQLVQGFTQLTQRPAHPLLGTHWIATRFVFCQLF